MRFGFIFILSLGLAPALSQAAVMGCADNERTVELSAKLNKNLGKPHNLRIMSGGKTKLVKREDVTKVRSNAADFYLLFTVQTKHGREELELDVHFKPGDRKSAAGHLTNKTQKSERLPILCSFT